MGCFGYDTKLHLMLKIQRVWSILSFPLLPGSPLYRLVVFIRIQLIGQIDLFKNYPYSIGPCAKKYLTTTQKV